LLIGALHGGSYSGLRASVAEAALLDPASYGPVARAGVAESGRFGGQCFPWMRRIVQEATGIVIGTDYRLGYLEAGAVEVPLTSAQHGDIIQLADDRNTLPTADYPGLHTAIVLDNLGGGKFRVIESNANFDGVVRVRESFEPLASAQRFPNISVHVYRLPNAPVRNPAEPGGSLASSAPLIPGVPAVIVADGDCLRVRATPRLSGQVMGCIATGAHVTVSQVGGEADGYRWSQVHASGINGWVADRYLHALAANANSTPEPPKPPSTEGKIVGGAVPEKGFGLIVFGGGSTDQLVAAAACSKQSSAFWASLDGQFVSYVPAATVAVVNAGWNAQFGGGIPASTALIARCDLAPTPEVQAPAVAAPAPSEVPSSPAATEASVTPPAAAPTSQPAEAPPQPAAPTPTSHTVVEGETLSGIAARYCPADADLWEYMERLREVNGMDPDGVLSVGVELQLPQ
jgi:hypothetical protein